MDRGLTDAGYNGPVCVEVEDEAFTATLEGRKRSLRISRNVLQPLIAVKDSAMGPERGKWIDGICPDGSVGDAARLSLSRAAGGRGPLAAAGGLSCRRMTSSTCTGSA